MCLPLTDAVARLEMEYETLDTMTSNVLKVHIARTMLLWEINKEAQQAEPPKTATSIDQKQQACPSLIPH